MVYVRLGWIRFAHEGKFNIHQNVGVGLRLCRLDVGFVQGDKTLRSNLIAVCYD